MTSSCENCAYFVPSSGECRRVAPRPSPPETVELAYLTTEILAILSAVSGHATPKNSWSKVLGETLWPVVKPSDWCGQFSERD